jgi:hypothetical protein
MDERNLVSIFAQSEEDSSYKKKEPKNNNNNNDLTTITVQIDKNSIIDNENNDNLLKIVGYLNGEGKTKYADLKDIDKEINQNQKF